MILYDDFIDFSNKTPLRRFPTTKLLGELKRRYKSEMAILDYIEMIECEVRSLQ